MRRSRGSSRKRQRAPRTRGSAYLSRSVLCTLTGISEHQLSLWEFEDFIAPAAVLEIEGEPQRVYDDAALSRIRTIRSLAEDLEVNLQGIGVILHLLDRLGLR